jgi:putative transposon-encoded protein
MIESIFIERIVPVNSSITIQIPKEYVNKELEILIIPSKDKRITFVMDPYLKNLLDNPIKLKDFKPLSRDEIYE